MNTNPSAVPALESLRALDESRCAGLGAYYDGSARGAGSSFFVPSSASRPAALPRARLEPRLRTSSPVKSPVVRKAKSAGAGALLGLLLFGGLVGALAGITVLSGLKAVFARFMHRK